ncbi:MAG TPA: MerR family transcriptional regulator [Candidatus Limnocylindrales bacterium]|nr:MerR family transcriptional regulator [Candidatus Limnocylindrales bacterium]
MTPSLAPAAAELRPIREVARLVGLTPRAIRYYEGLGLIEPAARSSGAYRLFSDHDIERLRRIKALREDAGFSLAEIGRFVADEEALAHVRTAYRATPDPLERRRLASQGVARLESQVELLRAKIGRLAAMVGEAEARRAKLLAAIAELDAAVKVEA